MTRNATATLAEFAATTRFEDIDPQIRELSRLLIIDSLGCAIAGHLVSKGTIPRDLVRRMGGEGAAAVIGERTRCPIPFACLANGELINALDFDAILAPGHVVPYVVPPALAFAERADASGQELIAAVAIAHEVGCRVAAALDGIRRWDDTDEATATRLSPASGYGSTIFGAVAGAGAILRFDGRQMANLFGIAGYAAPVPSLAKFLHAKHSFHAKYTSAGQLAMSAAVCTELAAAGYHGDESILDGDFGFWKMFASQSCNWDFMLGELGTSWRMVRNEFKPYPCFRMSHDAITVLRELIAEHRVDPGAITRITATADPICLSECYLSTSLTDHTDAQLSWRRLLATAAFYPPGPEWQTTALDDPRVLALSARIEIIPAVNSTDALQILRTDASFNKAYPAWLKSTLEFDAGGTVLRKAAPPITKGHPANPMTPAEIEAKYLVNASSVLGPSAAQASLALLKEMERHSTTDIVRALTPPPDRLRSEARAAGM
jgi:2-methylcitrate dehydratase PrpD